MSDHDPYKKIKLTRGQVAWVSPHCFKELARFKWQAHWDPKTRSFRANRSAWVNGKRITIWMHREILGLKYGDPRQGDHRESGKTLDNRDSNLRIATRPQNVHNQRVQKRSKSGFKGVCYVAYRRKYLVRIMVDRKSRHLGYCDTAEEGHKLYCEHAQKLHGEFARFA